METIKINQIEIIKFINSIIFVYKNLLIITAYNQLLTLYLLSIILQYLKSFISNFDFFTHVSNSVNFML